MTEQIPDVLIIPGKKGQMLSCPSLPREHPRIVRSSVEDASLEGWLTGTTACYRGYVAYWRLEEERLFLTSIAGRLALVGDTPLFADWFSGILVVDQTTTGGYEAAQRGEPMLYIKIRNGQVRVSTVLSRNWCEKGWFRLPGFRDLLDIDELFDPDQDLTITGLIAQIDRRRLEATAAEAIRLFERCSGELAEAKALVEIGNLTRAREVLVLAERTFIEAENEEDKALARRSMEAWANRRAADEKARKDRLLDYYLRKKRPDLYLKRDTALPASVEQDAETYFEKRKKRHQWVLWMLKCLSR